MNQLISQAAALIFITGLCGMAFGAAPAPDDDPGWPRVFKNGNQQLAVHQSQDYWNV